MASVSASNVLEASPSGIIEAIFGSEISGDFSLEIPSGSETSSVYSDTSSGLCLSPPQRSYYNNKQSSASWWFVSGVSGRCLSPPPRSYPNNEHSSTSWWFLSGVSRVIPIVLETSQVAYEMDYLHIAPAWSWAILVRPDLVAIWSYSSLLGY